MLFGFLVAAAFVSAIEQEEKNERIRSLIEEKFNFEESNDFYEEFECFNDDDAEFFEDDDEYYDDF